MRMINSSSFLNICIVYVATYIYVLITDLAYNLAATHRPCRQLTPTATDNSYSYYYSESESYTQLIHACMHVMMRLSSYNNIIATCMYS